MRLSLRTLLIAASTIVSALALVGSVALVVLATALHSATTTATNSVESVRLAQEAEIDLLLAERTRDPLVKRRVQQELRRMLEAARPFVTTGDESRVLDAAETAVDAYLDAPAVGVTAEDDARYHVAYGALEDLVSVNVAAARRAGEQAARWDALANGIGLAIGVLTLVAAAIVIGWLRWSAFAPALSLAAAMERFGQGERDARAEERGATELRDMSRRFNEMAAALATQRDAQMAFLGGVAHDLRNPLSVLQMAVKLARPDEPPPDEAQLRKMLAMIDRQIGRMQRMLGDFLDMARIEAGGLELQVAEHDLLDVVREVCAFVDVPNASHPLRLTLPDTPVVVRCDRLRVEQVLTNLVSNAMKYSPPGSPVEVSVERAADDVEIAVTDQGLGITEDERAKLFEPFRRVGRAAKTAPGIGLGLFVVKKIVEGHGGDVLVRSEPGRGSTFRVRLPRTPSPSRASVRPT